MVEQDEAVRLMFGEICMLNEYPRLSRERSWNMSKCQYFSFLNLENLDLSRFLSLRIFICTADKITADRYKADRITADRITADKSTADRSKADIIAADIIANDIIAADIITNDIIADDIRGHSSIT